MKTAVKNASIAGGIILAIVVVAAVVITLLLDQPKPQLLKDRLVELADVTTYKYEYKGEVTHEQAVELLFASLATDKTNVTYSGYIKVGTDLSKAVITSDPKSDAVTVIVPKSTVLDNVVDTDSLVFKDEGTLLKSLTEVDQKAIFDLINKHKQQIEDEKVSAGLLEMSDERVKMVVAKFFGDAGFSNVTVETF